MPKHLSLTLKTKNVRVEGFDNEQIRDLFDKHIRKPVVQGLLEAADYPDVGEDPKFVIHNKRVSSSVHLMKPKRGKGTDVVLRLNRLRFDKQSTIKLIPQWNSRSVRRHSCGIHEFIDFVGRTGGDIILDQISKLEKRKRNPVRFVNRKFSFETSTYYEIS